MRVIAGVRPNKRNAWRMSASIDTNARTSSNLMPPIRDAANAYATVDVASCRPRSAFGEYREA